MIWLVATGVVLVVGVVVVLAVVRGEHMVPAHDDRRDVRLPEGRHLRADDLAAIRFNLAARGYRRSEVDALLGRLQVELGDAARGNSRDPTDVTAARSEQRYGPRISDGAGDPEERGRAR